MNLNFAHFMIQQLILLGANHKPSLNPPVVNFSSQKISLGPTTHPFPPSPSPYKGLGLRTAAHTCKFYI